ncbi:MAG: cbb3-type cytochrome c oxidase subunit I [Acetobacteraceae bacterium]|nr:cbb3-type cytochrome c oxidase subunit I [Acetobacteraceae bacterium]
MPRPRWAKARWAWAGYALGVVGTLMAVATVFMGRASVLYTFYPPLIASPFYYIGTVLVIAGSWIWCVLMIMAMARFKRANPGMPVPLAMFATVANAILWLWTTIGVAAEVLFLVLPAALGWRQTLDIGLTRTLFSWTLHAIVYFWLIPSYTAFYTMAPRAAGGRLFSDMMGRLTFVAFLLYSLPVGMHHLFMDPEHSTGFKFVHMFLTLLVTVPTLLTVFTITASMEIAGRLRGGQGLFGWIWALPWDRPMVLATGLSFVMLFWGGGGGLINMSYGVNAMVHNTSWVTAHFHLIFGGTAVIMYFAIAYEIWPQLTGRQAGELRSQRTQLWLWTIGMFVLTLPWHWLGLAGQWRRVAHFNYADPVIAWWAPWVDMSVVGGFILLVSALLFVRNLAARPIAREAMAPASTPNRIIYAQALHPPHRVPIVLNGFATWNVVVLVLMLAAYAYPIAQFFIIDPPRAVVHHVDGVR